MPAALDNPFQPGSGVAPPHMSGRDEDMQEFLACMGKAGQGISPGPVVLMAPRGQGKTALLGRMVDAAPSHWDLDPSSVPTGDALLKRIRGLSAAGGDVPAGKGVAWKARLKMGFFEGARESAKASESAVASVSDLLCSAARRKPLLIAVDEAHTLSVEAGHLLFQGEQTARRAGAKTQLVIAGTPDLPAQIGKMRVTFWDRLGKRLRLLQLLEERDAIDVIEQPFHKLRDLRLARESHQDIMDLTSGYPYFLQLLGEALWDTVPQDAREVTQDDVRVAAAAFLESKADYYMRRMDEIDSTGLSGAAFAVVLAHRYRDGHPLTRRDVEIACRCGAALGFDANCPEGAADRYGGEMGNLLQHKGFVWRAKRGADELSPGIPTLMDHIFDCVTERHPDAEERLLGNTHFRNEFLQSNNPPAPL